VSDFAAKPIAMPEEDLLKRIESGADFVRYTIGELTIVALRDGYVDMPPSRLRQEGDRPFGAELPGQVTLVDGRLRLSVNAFLVVEPGGHTLIDTGAANAWEPTMGFLLRALGEAGVARDDIRTVALTHTHVDHVSGLVAADGSDAFPKLDRLFVPQEEVAMFDSNERLARFRRRCVPFPDGCAMSSRITAVQTRGHEVGHTAFEVAGAGETLLIWGDIVHVPSIQFARPELTWEFDADQAQARSARKRILDRAARPGAFVAGAHLDFPGVGSVARADGGFAFAPL
jgi:glyoxylase-like metal-dependent hydrolase (beta-lactamase superfamily II)